jgi:hypothetical protein
MNQVQKCMKKIPVRFFNQVALLLHTGPAVLRYNSHGSGTIVPGVYHRSSHLVLDQGNLECRNLTVYFSLSATISLYDIYSLDPSGYLIEPRGYLTKRESVTEHAP